MFKVTDIILGSDSTAVFFGIEVPALPVPPPKLNERIYARKPKPDDHAGWQQGYLNAWCYWFIQATCAAGTHFIDFYPGGSCLYLRRLRRIPVQVVVRNAVTAENQFRRYPGAKLGYPFSKPVIEYFLSQDPEGKPGEFFCFAKNRSVEVFDPGFSRFPAPSKTLPFSEIVPEGMKADQLWDHFYPPPSPDPKNLPWGIPQAALRIAKTFSEAWRELGVFQAEMRMDFGVDELGNYFLMTMFGFDTWTLWPIGASCVPNDCLSVWKCGSRLIALEAARLFSDPDFIERFRVRDEK